MIANILIYTGSIIVIGWGIAHIIAARAVVKGFGDISGDNKKFILMEWVAEGLTLCFIGVLVMLTGILGGTTNSVARIVFRTSAGMLIVMAIWTALTGAKTSNIPTKICPFVLTFVAILWVVGSFI
jgi:cell division protein FtsX